MIPKEWIENAYQRIAPYVHTTPITFDPQLEIYLKWENQQITGSFKLRGAMNKILSLDEWERQRGVVAASAGNHGAGLAFACKKAGIKATIFVPHTAPQVKVNAIREYGAEVRYIKGGYTETEQFAIQFSKETGQPYISPYNDAQIIVGQGTLAIETLQALADTNLKAWLVPVGGGGLLSGIGTTLDAFLPKDSMLPRLIGVQSEASPYMRHLYYTETQKFVVEEPSIADGLAGAVEENSITIPLIKQYADAILLVSEEEIRAAIRYAWLCYHQVIEGSAAVVLAAVLSGKVSERPALLVISGGNIDPDLHRTIVEAEK
ncbi:MAG: Threonine dehydratase, catabolic [Anaerolineae bacterium]|nr:MAG: Threonine dehydratase, catabolic [Anaerolineae bacterium]